MAAGDRPTSANARSAILKRIRAANSGMSNEQMAQAQWLLLERSYRQRGTLERERVLDLLEERLLDYDAQVFRASSDRVARQIAAILQDRQVSKIVVPAGLPSSWLPEDLDFLEDDGFSATNLDTFAAVLTGATVAIAQTGTVALQNTAGQGRRAISLVPDLHLCVVRTQDVVETLPEAMVRLQPTASLPTTFISGPSATADIEMTRHQGCAWAAIARRPAGLQRARCL